MGPAGTARPVRTSRTGTPLRLLAALLAACALTLGAPATGGAAPTAPAAEPTVELSHAAAPKGARLTVRGHGWRPRTLLTLLLCGQSTPARGVIGGTNACANADGRAVTTATDGSFAKDLPVVAPPTPCPCVVHVATVTGPQATVDAALTVTGHPVAPLPDGAGDGRLAVLSTGRLTGSSGLLVWFGAPASRRIVLTVGNLGSGRVKDPVFEVGFAHGVYAPQWEEHQWRGTVRPGGRAAVELPVHLPAGAHGDYRVLVRHGGRVLAEHPWDVARPWGVTLFWVLLAVVVPTALYRAGMAVVDRVRPRRPAAAAPPAAALPWFTQDSAPSPNRPTTKGQS
ncbi:hypothetical protein ACFPM3_21190 [Streptomyces coeruleoprunus]|uniref:Neocarzinostatin family protein n=1 Tax=Streptomyces coeruleoprunus TaxID=285563 RepID=A0ABV9XJN1_9ACTN